MHRHFALGLLATLFAPSLAFAQDKELFYVGTYTDSGGKGIYLFEMDKATGKIANLGAVAETTNPTFLALHPTKPVLYAVAEVTEFAGKKGGGVAAFQIDPKDKKLTLLNTQSSGGNGPCHVSVDKSGKHVFVANFGGGSVAMLPIKDDGSLGEATSVQQHVKIAGNKLPPYAHAINLDRANKFAIVNDLGNNTIYVYRVEGDKLTPNDPPGIKLAPGAGPRHFAFHPNGKVGFAINESNMTLTSFHYDADKGTLTEIETLDTIPKDASRKGTSTAEVIVHPSGKWVLGSNRGNDTIAVFAFDASKAKLTRVGNYGDTIKTPRNFVLDPSGNFVLVGNQSNDTITVFRFNQQTGEMTRVGDPVACPRPVCLRFLPKG